jgi:hypothetical protein
MAGLGLLWGVCVALTACAGVPLAGSTSWREEVLLHDGGRIIVTRSQTYGGRHEIGQPPPVREHTINFTLPNTNTNITWVSEYGEDVGRANFNLVAVHILNNTPYVVASPNLCLSYNKWGRPNPPYVLFKFDGGAWQRIALAELPPEFKEVNVVVNVTREQYIKEHERRAGYVQAADVRDINSSLTQPEYQRILREALPKERINAMCMEMVLYKGYWIMPNDPIAKRMIDSDAR